MRFANAEKADYPPQKYKVDLGNFTGNDLGKLITLICKGASETEIDLFLRNKLSLLSFTG